MVSFLFSFRGRINRVQYWAGSLAVGVGAVMLIFVLAVVAGVGAPMDKNAGLQGAIALVGIVGVVSLISGWAGLALQTKRFHDRNQPGWLCMLPLLPAFGIAASIVVGVTAGQTPSQFLAAVQPYVLALWVINLFLFINLGCLAGTDGPNRYGRPPGGSPSPSSKPAPRPPQPIALGGVEAAMERAIAEQVRQPAPQMREPAALRPGPALTAAPAGGAASFGRRPAR